MRSAYHPASVAYYASRTTSRASIARNNADDADDHSSSGFSAPVARQRFPPMVEGNRAVIRNGIAYAPSNAPERVKSAIWAVNTINRKPYVWGGGHGSFSDRGYDCSGTVSFALHHAGLLSSPLPSSDLMRYGERGRGRWFTVYSRRGHTFAMIAGLRLDTTDFRYGGDVGPRWHNDIATLADSWPRIRLGCKARLDGVSPHRRLVHTTSFGGAKKPFAKRLLPRVNKFDWRGSALCRAASKVVILGGEAASSPFVRLHNPWTAHRAVATLA